MNNSIVARRMPNASRGIPRLAESNQNLYDRFVDMLTRNQQGDALEDEGFLIGDPSMDYDNGFGYGAPGRPLVRTVKGSAAAAVAKANRAREAMNAGAIPQAANVPFFSTVNCKMVNGPIKPGASYIAAKKTYLISHALGMNPYQTKIKDSGSSGGSATVTFTATEVISGATSVLFPFMVIQLTDDNLHTIIKVYQVAITWYSAGGAALSGMTTFSIMPTKAAGAGLNCEMYVTPFTLISSDPVPQMGAMDATAGHCQVVASGMTDTMQLTVKLLGTNDPHVIDWLSKSAAA